MTLKRSARSAFLILTCVSMASCPQPSALWILEGSTADDLVFVVGNHQGKESQLALGYLLVVQCGPGCTGERPRMWAIADPLADTVHPRASRVHYGTVPEGFVEEQPATPLVTGCYNASVEGTGRVRFCVDSSRAVVAVSP